MEEKNYDRKDSSAERLITMLKTALGPFVADLLSDEKVTELMLNQDGLLWADRLGQGREFTGHRIEPLDARRIIQLVASSTGAECSEENPILSAEFPGTGSRFQGLLAPVVSAPVFTIRKKALMIFSLEDYVTQGILSEGADPVRRQVQAKHPDRGRNGYREDHLRQRHPR